MTITLNQIIIFFFLHQNQKFFFKQHTLSTTEMKLTQHACYAEQLKRMYYTSFFNVKNYSRRE
jgi:hypothetical protein